MHNTYSDIRALTDVAPKWYDENGVPRYCDFHPDQLATIYANEAVLALIQCQACGTRFHVAFSELNQKHKLWADDQKTRTAYLSDLIMDRDLHYGDPPNTECCDAGPSMNSVPIAVIEYWHKPYIRMEPRTRIMDTSLLNWMREDKFERSVRKDGS